MAWTVANPLQIFRVSGGGNVPRSPGPPPPGADTVVQYLSIEGNLLFLFFILILEHCFNSVDRRMDWYILS